MLNYSGQKSKKYYTATARCEEAGKPLDSIFVSGKKKVTDDFFFQDLYSDETSTRINFRLSQAGGIRGKTLTSFIFIFLIEPPSHFSGFKVYASDGFSITQ